MGRSLESIWRFSNTLSFSPSNSAFFGSIIYEKISFSHAVRPGFNVFLWNIFLMIALIIVLHKCRCWKFACSFVNFIKLKNWSFLILWYRIWRNENLLSVRLFVYRETIASAPWSRIREITDGNVKNALRNKKVFKLLAGKIFWTLATCKWNQALYNVNGFTCKREITTTSTFLISRALKRSERPSFCFIDYFNMRRDTF
jgi:hypothetical protein